MISEQMELLARSRAWTFQRQRLGQDAPSVTDALRGVIGVYSAHPAAQLALWARTCSFSSEDFNKLEEDRRAARISSMRGSIFLLLNDDAVLAFTALRSPVKLTPAWLKSSGIEAHQYPALKEKLLAAAVTPLLPSELRAATGVAEEYIASVAKVVAREGEILRVGTGGLRSNSLRYVTTAAWLPALLDPRDADAALHQLAARYLAAFGPARIADFAWWAGVSKARAKKAIDALDTVDLGGGLLLPAAGFADFERTAPLPPDSVAILPKWDSYTMGYAPDGRARFVAPEMQSRVYVNVGDGLGVVLLAGKAVAAWSGKFTGNRMDITLDIFDNSASRHMGKIEEKFGEVARVLDGKSCVIALSDSPLAAKLGYNRVRKAAGSD